MPRGSMLRSSQWHIVAWIVAVLIGCCMRSSAFLLSPTSHTHWRPGSDTTTPPNSRRISCNRLALRKPNSDKHRLREWLTVAQMTAVDPSEVKTHPAEVQTSVEQAAAGALVPIEELEEWMIDVWRGRDGHCADDEEEAMIGLSGSGDMAGTYGEITVEGFRTLMERLGLGSDDVFMDLGSGVGRTVMHAWLEFGVIQSCGVEMSPSRHARAERALAEIATLVERKNSECEIGGSMQGIGTKSCIFMDSSGLERIILTEGNMLDFDISGATVIWASTLCFSESFMRTLADKLSTEAPLLRAVATLSEFPDGIDGFSVAQSMQLPMSWNSRTGGTTCVYVYHIGDETGA